MCQVKLDIFKWVTFYQSPNIMVNVIRKKQLTVQAQIIKCLLDVRLMFREHAFDNEIIYADYSGIILGKWERQDKLVFIWYRNKGNNISDSLWNNSNKKGTLYFAFILLIYYFPVSVGKFFSRMQCFCHNNIKLSHVSKFVSFLDPQNLISALE